MLRDLAVTAGAATALAAAGVAAAAWEAHRFELREATVPVLPPGSPPLRVLHVSDIHLIPSQADKVAWLRDLASLGPDLVIDTGDNFGHPDSLWPLLHALEPLLGFPGAFVLGSNDYFAPGRKNPLRYLLPGIGAHHHREKAPDLPTAVFTSRLRSAGWTDLTNRRDAITLRGTHVALVGMDDPHINRDTMPAPGSASDSTGLRLGVVHAPYARALAALWRDGADMILAGHTHGGQLCLPGIGALVTNCDLDRERVAGLHGWPGDRPDSPAGRAADSTWLHVSGGVGTSPQVRLRFACRPSATLLTLAAR